MWGDEGQNRSKYLHDSNGMDTSAIQIYIHVIVRSINGKSLNVQVKCQKKRQKAHYHCCHQVDQLPLLIILMLLLHQVRRWQSHVISRNFTARYEWAARAIRIAHGGAAHGGVGTIGVNRARGLGKTEGAVVQRPSLQEARLMNLAHEANKTMFERERDKWGYHDNLTITTVGLFVT
jgi:hypothetical protein